MNSVIDAALSRARTVLSLMVISLLSGVIAYINIPKENDPDIPIPFVLVTIPHPGISPADAERLLIKPMERKLQSMEGLKELKANALEGAAYIAMEFDVNFDQDQALIDVREKVDLAKVDLPQDTEEPIVTELNASLFPVMVVSLAGEVPERKLYELARDLKDKIEALPSVLEANLAGNREDLLEVIIDPAKLEAYNISQQELVTAVTANNRLIAAGALDTGSGRFQVKVPGLFERAKDVYDLAIKVSGDGVVTLSDLASIRRTFKDPTGFARFNGKPAVAIQVVKRIGANIIETNQTIRDIVTEESQLWVDNVQVEFTLDQSRFIRDALGQLQAAVMTAISLVMIIVVAALGVRSGMMVGIAIPTSFLLGFVVLSWTGTTVNVMVMFGLVLSVGILVDGAIVVVEYADRKMAEGLNRLKAYGMAAKRMAWPIISSTMTTLAAFIPLLLWPGITGKFMAYLPYTLIIILMSSLVVALIFLPVLGSLIGRSQVSDNTTMKALAADAAQSLQESAQGFTGKYIHWVSKAIRHPFKMMAAAIILISLIIGGYVARDVDTMFFIDGDPENIMILIGARGNLSTEEERDLVTEVESVVFGIPGIRAMVTSTGGTSTASAGPETPAPDDTIGRINIELENWRTRQSGNAIVDEIRRRVASFAGLHIEVRVIENGPPVGKDVQLEITSDNGALLLEEVRRMREIFDGVEGLIDIEDSRPLPGIEWELRVDREQAGRFGADVTQVGVMVQLVTNGFLIGEYRPDDAEDEVEIRVRYPDEERNINQLDHLRVQTNQGLVPIASFVKRTPQPQETKIERIDGERVIYVRANTAPGYAVSRKVAEIEGLLTDAQIDERVAYRFRGADEESEAAQGFLGGALLGALFLMSLILLTQFNSFYHVVLTLVSIIISTVGVLLGIIITGQNFSVVMTGVGIIALAGIVVNNNIVLIDTYQRLLAAGYDVYDAVLRTAAQRLRPVLLTTITTICGLLPMALQINVDYIARDITYGGPIALWWVELSTAIIFGLAFATLITLVLTPSLLALPQTLKERNFIRKVTDFVKKKLGLKTFVQPAE